MLPWRRGEALARATAPLRPLSLRTSTEGPHERPSIPDLGSTLLLALLAGAVAVAGPVLDVRDHGEAIQRSAWLLGAGTLVVALVVVVGVRRGHVLTAAAVGLGVAGATAGATSSVVGRIPTSAALATVVVTSALALAPRIDPRRSSPPWAAWLALVGAELLWAVDGQRSLIALPLAVAAGTAAVALLRPDATAVPDAVLDRAVRRGSAATRAAVGTAARRTASRGAEVAGRTTDRAGKVRRAGRRRGRTALVGVRARARRVGWPPVAVGAAAALASAPIWWLLGTPAARFAASVNDHPNHIAVASQLQLWPPRSYSPHPLFAGLVRAVGTGLPRPVAAAAVLSLAYGAWGALLYLVARRSWDRRPGAGPVLALVLPLVVLLGEAPSRLVPVGPGWWQRPVFDELGTGPHLFVLHAWGSPTTVLALPLALLLVVALAELIEGPDLPRRPLVRRTGSLAVLTVVASLAKPALTLVLLVAVPAAVVLTRRLRTAPVPTLLGGFVVPGVLVCLGQTWFLASGVSPDETVGWTVDPLWMVEPFALHRPIMWAPIALFALCLALGGRRYLADPPVRLLLLCAAASTIPTFVLRETGTHASHGNLAWTMVFSLTLLQVLSARFVLLELRDRWAARPSPGRAARWALPAAALGLVALAAGVRQQAALLGWGTY